ncbi:MAG TPA: hypothetical protein VN848_11075 [Gemmatimonadales bacterium]|nr:hypothetical protein [Gemmatimonadales bacterium]
MNQRLRRATVIALALSVAGCAMTFDASHLGVTATMAEPLQSAGTGAAFSITKHPVYILWGLFPAAEPNLEDLLAGQLGAGASIAGLHIYTRTRFTDVLATVLTFGIVSPRSVTFEGVVVGH